MHRGLGEDPRSPVLLLLHGGGVASWMWRPLVDALDARWRVLAPDLPGHGARSAEDYVSHEQTVGELAGLLEAERCDTVTVVGFSLGAQLAVLLAAAHPSLVDGVVAISAQAQPSRAPGAILVLLGTAAPLARYEWFARLQAKELFIPPEMLDDYVRASREISRRTLLTAVSENLRFGVPQKWGEYVGRATILVGAKEPRLMRDSARSLHEALPGSELEMVAGCGHGLPLQRPAWLASRIGAP